MDNNQGISSLLTGLTQGVTKYLDLGNELKLNSLKEQQKSADALKLKTAESALDINKEQQKDKYKTGLEDVLSPDMAEQALPGYGAKMVNDYNSQHADNPLKLKDGISYLKQAHDVLNPDGNKETTRQDKLEQQARQMQTGLRGDQSLMRTEVQRDAAGQAYDTLANVKSQGRPMSELEYEDLLGQMWKARTGTAPAENVMKDLKAKTGQGDINKVYQYFTGNPTEVGATSDKVIANLQDFITQSGNKVDEQHAGYWDTRMKKPTGLDADRWDAIKNENRGHSFADQKALSDQKYNQVDMEAKKQALRKKLGL